MHAPSDMTASASTRVASCTTSAALPYRMVRYVERARLRSDSGLQYGRIGAPPMTKLIARHCVVASCDSLAAPCASPGKPERFYTRASVESEAPNIADTAPCTLHSRRCAV